MAKKETIKSFVLRVDAEIMEAIEKWAADEFRSTNGQLQWIIAEALRKSGRMKKKKTIIKKEETEWYSLSNGNKVFPTVCKSRKMINNQIVMDFYLGWR